MLLKFIAVVSDFRENYNILLIITIPQRLRQRAHSPQTKCNSVILFHTQTQIINYGTCTFYSTQLPQSFNFCSGPPLSQRGGHCSGKSKKENVQIKPAVIYLFIYLSIIYLCYQLSDWQTADLFPVSFQAI